MIALRFGLGFVIISVVLTVWHGYGIAFTGGQIPLKRYAITELRNVDRGAWETVSVSGVSENDIMGASVVDGGCLVGVDINGATSNPPLGWHIDRLPHSLMTKAEFAEFANDSACYNGLHRISWSGAGIAPEYGKTNSEKLIFLVTPLLNEEGGLYSIHRHVSALGRNVNLMRFPCDSPENISRCPQQAGENNKRESKNGESELSNFRFANKLVHPIAFFPVACLCIVTAIYFVRLGYLKLKSPRWFPGIVYIGLGSLFASIGSFGVFVGPIWLRLAVNLASKTFQ